MKSFVINLKRDPKRLETFFSSAAQFGWEAERFEAIDRANLRIDEREEAGETVNHLRDPKIIWEGDKDAALSAGHYGNALSHILLWQLVLDEHLPAICIFEDDVIFERSRDLPPLPEDADFVFINDRVSCLVPDGVSDEAELMDWASKTPYAPLFPGCGIEAYIVTAAGAAKGLELMQPMFYPLDLQLMAYGHGTAAKEHGLVQKRRPGKPECKIYATTQTYTRHEDGCFSHVNDPSLPAR